VSDYTNSLNIASQKESQNGALMATVLDGSIGFPENKSSSNTKNPIHLRSP